MRAPLFSALIVALLGSTSAVADGPTTLGYANNHNIEPVLVQVNAKGQVTDFTPAYPLSSELTRLLRGNLNEMIHTPATDKNGKPVSSQFILNVTLQADARSTGDGYDAHFVYVSASPVPAGKWYWSHDTTGKLGLVSRDVLNFPVNNSGPPNFSNSSAFGSSASMSGGGGVHSGGGRGH